MISKRSALILWTWSILSQTAIVKGFSPGDVSSIAAAAAAAHIGKPPPFLSPSRQDRTAKSNNKDYSYINFHMNRISDVIGKAPNGQIQQQQPTPAMTSTTDQRFHLQDIKVIQMKKLSVESTEYTNHAVPENILTAKRVTFDVKERDFERILVEKLFELDNYILNQASTETYSVNKCIDCDEESIESIPTVHAVFCGYKATMEELSRLRSAHVP